MVHEVSEKTLGRDECLALLKKADLARLILSIDSLPTARPTMIAMTDQTLMAVVMDGNKLDHALLGNVVTLEIDGFDSDQSSLWSVCVTGVANELSLATSEISQEFGAKIARIPESGGKLISISTDVIEGQRSSLPHP